MSVERKFLDAMLGHTPGPWSYKDDGHQYVGKGAYSLRFRVPAIRAKLHGCEADARLIAAAPDLLAEVMERRAKDAAVAELMEALQQRVASSLEEARAADDRGERLIWCEGDVLNPCWTPDMPITVPLLHWGYTEGAEGDCLACSECRLRAALAAVRGGA